MDHGTSKIMGSWPWPFGVTWRHRSHDIQLAVFNFLWVVHCDHVSLSGTVMEIWCLEDMYTDTHTDETTDTMTNRTTNLIISSNVH